MDTNDIENAFSALEASLKHAAWAKREQSVHHLRDRGWNDLADVISYQIGREAVRCGMQDIIKWCNYKEQL